MNGAWSISRDSTGVACGGELERGLRDRQPIEPVDAATQSAGGTAEDVIVEAARVVLGDRAHRLAAVSRYGSARLLVGPSPGGATFPSSMSRASLAFSARSPAVSTPDPAAREIGSPPRPRRMIAHPTAIAAPISGPATYTQ
jgi:hypothetical protein